jgi:hypothetical protein
MSDEYPSDEDLERIMDWPISDAPAMLDFVHSLWWAPEFGWRRGDRWLDVSTGGWSGNEDIISALQRNTMFWMFCWESSRRGGHYRFDLARLPVDGGREGGES